MWMNRINEAPSKATHAKGDKTPSLSNNKSKRTKTVGDKRGGSSNKEKRHAMCWNCINKGEIQRHFKEVFYLGKPKS